LAGGFERVTLPAAAEVAAAAAASALRTLKRSVYAPLFPWFVRQVLCLSSISPRHGAAGRGPAATARRVLLSTARHAALNLTASGWRYQFSVHLT